MPLRLVMMGTGTFAEPTLEAILPQVVGVVTQPDRDRSEVRGSTRQVGRGVKAIAEAVGIPVYQPESINTPEGVEQLKAWSPDLLVVAAYGQILKREVLEAARLGGINVHGSLLPKYRGAAPVVRAILEGEACTGVTIIRMTTGLDAGDMLTQSATPIDEHETAGELELRLATIGSEAAKQIVEQLNAGPVPGQKQNVSLVTKAPKLKKEDGLIDWSKAADLVGRHIRAMQPWPTPFTFLHRQGQPPQRFLILKAQIGAPVSAPPGSVVQIAEDNFEVAAGENSTLRVLELQPAGKRRMMAGEFLRGRPLKIGDRFGPELLG